MTAELSYKESHPYPPMASNQNLVAPQIIVQPRKLANPAPLGLFSFASTTLLLSLVNVQARGVTQPNAAVGMAYGVGGLAQLLAGMWEFACGNTFGATAFTSYGGFWISFGLLLTPGSGMLAALEKDLTQALTLYLATWFVFTFIMLLGCLRSNWGLISLFFCLDVTFFLLMLGHAYPHTVLTKVGGAGGLLTAAIAYYLGTAELCPEGASVFTLPVGKIGKRE